MSEEWVPKNKEQAEGFKLGQSIAKAVTDQIKEKDAEIKRLTGALETIRRYSRYHSSHVMQEVYNETVRVIGEEIP